MTAKTGRPAPMIGAGAPEYTGPEQSTPGVQLAKADPMGMPVNTTMTAKAAKVADVRIFFTLKILIKYIIILLFVSRGALPKSA
jgi:hypothetical protein